MQTRKSPREHLDHVTDHSPRRRSNDSNLVRKARDRTLPACFEEPLRRELLFELLESELQRPVPLWLQRLHQELVFAASFEKIQMAARQRRDPVLRLKF